MAKNQLLQGFFRWRSKRINDRTFILIISAIIGIAVGFAAVIIKNLVHLIQDLLTSEFQITEYNLIYFALPFAGITATVVFSRFLLKRQIGHGIPSVLYAISKNNGIIRSHNLFSSVIASTLTVGFGGSVGLEGPTVATGAAIGSRVGKALRLNYKQILTLLGCASAGAMSAIFKAPIAAIVFALEVIMLNLTMASLLPLLISSVSAALISYIFLGTDVLYNFTLKEAFQIAHVPYYIILGVFAGLVSVYFTWMFRKVTEVFDRISHWGWRLFGGGVLLGVLIFIAPALYGEGYDGINLSLNGDYSYLFRGTFYYGFRDIFLAMLLVLAFIIVFKAIATATTFSAGGVGGVFAPTLFLGANAGLLFVLVTNSLGAGLEDSSFVLCGMAGLIAGVIHAPLTAIFLIAEITKGYELFFPLMITATISYATARIFYKRSVYTYQLSRRGELITHDKDKAALTLMNVRNLIETDFITIGPDATLGELVEVLSRSVRNIVPVIDDDGILLGVVWVNDIRHIVFKPDLYENTYVRDLMFMPEPAVSPKESMEEVAHKFQISSHYNLPVVQEGEYVGFVSRANVFSSYRNMIRNFMEE